MPAVTDPPRPNGLPTAITQSPTRARVESPNCTNGMLRPSIFSTARSAAVSRAISFALYSVRSGSVTVIDSTGTLDAGLPPEMT